MNRLQVQCVLCDVVENIDNHSIEAKRLRNRLSHMYLCQACNERIKMNTLKRHETGKFKLYSSNNLNDNKDKKHPTE